MPQMHSTTHLGYVLNSRTSASRAHPVLFWAQSLH
jgi:hypothetical protein